MNDFKHCSSQLHEFISKQKEDSSSSKRAEETLNFIDTQFHELLEKNAILEARLNESNRTARNSRVSINELSHRNNEFLSICAHDLKSPLSSILSFLDIIRSDWTIMSEHERNGIMERMDRAGKHMFTLINDLLDMGKIDSGKMTINPEATLLSQLCTDALEHSQGVFSSKEIDAHFTCDGTELKVTMDPQKGIQIISNLLSNAVKFTPRGGRIDLILSQQEKRMILEVKDSGQGIPKEELPIIFERFQKATTTSTEGERGSGLGLNIVKQLVDLHRGTIEVSSAPGKGTSFFLSFPVAESTRLLKLFSGKK